MQDSSIDFEVSDEHLNSVEYLINQGTFSNFEAPYDMDTTDWEDGEHSITVKADDTVGNTNEKWFIFIKDITPPSVESIYPNDNSIDISIEGNIIIDFSESMDSESVESALSINPSKDYSCLWSSDNTTLTMDFSELLEYETLYEISIGTQAKDLASNNLESKFEFEFTTMVKTKNDEDNFTLPIVILLTLLLIIIMGSIVVVLLLAKRKKTSKERIGAWPQLQDHSTHISCPQCGFEFAVANIAEPLEVQCPNCGAKGTMR
jgi:DNA-directed RNA polymerase subunit RPC12/RpoP